MASRDGWMVADLKTRQYSIKVCSKTPISQIIMSSGYLFTNVLESLVFSVILIRFTQDRVEGFVTIPPGCPGITRDGECCYINLKTNKTKTPFFANPQQALHQIQLDLTPSGSEIISNPNTPSSHMDHQCCWQCPAAQSTPVLH